MLTQEQKDSFSQNGYLLVPGVLNTGQIRTLRDFLYPRFKRSETERCPGDTEQVMFDVFSRNPEIRWLLFHEPAISALRSLLGNDFVVLREAAAHYQGFGEWHKDTTSQEAHGQKFQWDTDYLMVEAGYYLQDNSEEYGGGLDVQPGTHRLPDYYVRRSRNGLFHKIRNRVTSSRLKQNGISVPSKAGDLVIFHYRVNHRATQRQNPNPPLDREKMAIFIACSSNTRHVQAYHDYIASRPGYIYLKDGCPYPDDFIREADEHGILMP